MPRENKLTARVFAEILNPATDSGTYDTFLNVDKVLGLPETKELVDLKLRYKKLVQDCVPEIKVLAALEEIIIQMRSTNLQVIETELRLSISRNYIYARTLFFRQGQQMNDIRVVVGRTEDHGTDLDTLLHDKVFRDVCCSTLLGAMKRQIDSNIKNLKEAYAEYYKS